MADVNADKLKMENVRLEAIYPGKVLGIQSDVTKQEEVVELIRRAAEFGSGGLISFSNNAGSV